MNEIFTHKTLYIITIILFLIFNITVYNYFLYVQKHREELLLSGYLDSVGNLLLQDLKVASNSRIYNKSFFLFKKFSTTSENTVTPQTSDNVKIKPYAIYFKNPTDELILDLQELREILNKIFPNFINYQIIINGCNIAASEDYDHIPVLQKEYKVNTSISLVIKVGIKQDSSFYWLNNKKLYKNTLITAFSSFIIFLIFLYFYLKIKRMLEEKFSLLEEELYEEQKIKSALLSNRKIHEQLNRLFIKKSTEMYIKQELGVISGEEKIIKSISPDKYIFPMCLYDTSLEKINLIKLSKALEEYFAPYFINVALKIKTITETISINCANEVFYQLIFSLIFNLIEFMDRQSEFPKIIEINFYDNKAVINYDSFPLDEEKMVNLSDTITSEYIDIFLLNCRKIFKSLKDHKFEYIIFSKDEQNIVELTYPMRGDNIERQECQILNLSKYKKRKRM